METRIHQIEIERSPRGSYGFSWSWSKPPRIERVEPRLPASQAGLLPRDHVIFVSGINVLHLNEKNMIDLIRKSNKTITLQIYREDLSHLSNECKQADPTQSRHFSCTSSAPLNNSVIIHDDEDPASRTFDYNVKHQCSTSGQNQCPTNCSEDRSLYHWSDHCPARPSHLSKPQNVYYPHPITSPPNISDSTDVNRVYRRLSTNII